MNNNTIIEVTFNISNNTVLFCKFFSTSISIISIPFFILAFIILYYRRKTLQMISFPLQISIALLLNIINYLLPYKKPIQYVNGTVEINIICRMQSLFHFISLLFTLNMFFIFYVFNYITFISLNTAASKKIRLLVYIINAGIIGVFLFVGISEEPCPTRLEYCRYYTSRVGPMLSAIYSLVIMIAIIIMFILIQCKVQQTINFSKNEDVIEILKNVRLYVVLIVSMLFIKILSYFFKEGQRKNAIFVIDRILENIITFLLLIMVVIGKKGFTEIQSVFKCKHKVQQDNVKENQMQHIIEPDLSRLSDASFE